MISLRCFSRVIITANRPCFHRRSRLFTSSRRFLATTTKEDVNVSHSQFLHGAGPQAHWNAGKSDMKPSEDELDGITDGMGKILPTSSHLFKLILPLTGIPNHSSQHNKLPLVILLHPAQPLSHLSRLILSSLKPSTPPQITFQSTSTPPYQWSDSTDIGDFIRDAARSAEFHISFSYDDGPKLEEHSISIRVPTFADRTVFLRRRLAIVNAQLESMEELKRVCDHEAKRGARRMALSGFGMLVVYWAAVARLTFWDFGWDVMEPVTYLSGLSTVICGYLWFLYQGREVSYSSVLERSVSSRREALYEIKGLDIDKWVDLIAERKQLNKEIGRIAEDYDTADEDKPKDKDTTESKS